MSKRKQFIRLRDLQDNLKKYNAFSINGYFPLFDTINDATVVSPVSSYHIHEFEGIEYYMPDGLGGPGSGLQFHGDYKPDDIESIVSTPIQARTQQLSFKRRDFLAVTGRLSDYLSARVGSIGGACGTISSAMQAHASSVYVNPNTGISEGFQLKYWPDIPSMITTLQQYQIGSYPLGTNIHDLPALAASLGIDFPNSISERAMFDDKIWLGVHVHEVGFPQDPQFDNTPIYIIELDFDINTLVATFNRKIEIPQFIWKGYDWVINTYTKTTKVSPNAGMGPNKLLINVAYPCNTPGCDEAKFYSLDVSGSTGVATYLFDGSSRDAVYLPYSNTIVAMPSTGFPNNTIVHYEIDGTIIDSITINSNLSFCSFAPAMWCDSGKIYIQDSPSCWNQGTNDPNFGVTGMWEISTSPLTATLRPYTSSWDVGSHFLGTDAASNPRCCEDPPFLPSWNCTPTGCEDPNDGTGTYTTLSACEDFCFSWNCTPTGCIDPGDQSGQYTNLSTCEDICRHWECVSLSQTSSQCNEVTGPAQLGNLSHYTSLQNCQIDCAIESWNCVQVGTPGNVTYTCLDPYTGLGQYNASNGGLAACQAACGPTVIPDTWDCEFDIDPLGNTPPSYYCVQKYDGSGQYYSLAACQARCKGDPQPPGESWDCDDNYNCYDPGTGLGQYQTLLACQAACKPGDSPRPTPPPREPSDTGY